MKYRSGQQVRIKICREDHRHILVTSHMEEMIGSIQEIDEDMNLEPKIKGYYFSDCMVEPVRDADKLYEEMVKSIKVEYPAHFMDWAQGGGGNMLNTLTKEQKEILSPEDQALIELGVTNNRFDLIDNQFVLKFLFNKYKKEIAAEAMAEVKAIKKAEKAK